MEYLRRASDRRTGVDRRMSERRRSGDDNGGLWRQQLSQFATRYAVALAGVLYFNLNGYGAQLGPLVVNGVIVLYFCVTSALLAHAWSQRTSPLRWHAAMWVDIVFVSFFVAVDGNPVPPTLLAYVMIVLGNGMRYGLAYFREAAIGSFLLGVIALYAHHSLNALQLNALWIVLFGALIVTYLYLLLARMERTRRELEAEGKRDALTGLLNRRALVEQTEVLFRGLERSNKPIAVLFADLNKFKEINDRLGHGAGDQVLAQIGELILSSIRKADIAARYGGDEFVMVLPETDSERATVVARRLQKSLRGWAQSHRLDIGISIGIGEAPRHGYSLSAVLENVDKALYRSKALASDGIQRVEDEPATSADGGLARLRQRVQEFAQARQWEQFHSPKNLVMALVAEAGELIEQFQWLTEEQSRALPPEKRQAVEHELADVLIYLIRLADRLGIDLEEAAWRKIAMNEEKYPIERSFGSAKKYNEL